MGEGLTQVCCGGNLFDSYNPSQRVDHQGDGKEPQDPIQIDGES